jgi:hypothetical protein
MDRIHLFRNAFITYEVLELEVAVTPPSAVTGIVLFTVRGNAEHTTFQGYFRFLFSAFEIGALFLFCTRLRLSNIAQWALEQQLTVAVVLAAILSNNPLYCYLRAYRPYFPAVIFGRLAAPLCHALACISVLVTIDSVGGKSAWPRGVVNHIEMVFGGCLFLTELFESAGQVFGRPIGLIDVIVGRVVMTLNVVFALWVVWLGAGTFSHGDLTEAGRTVLYLLASVLVVGCSINVGVIGKIFNLCEEGLEGSVSLFTGLNTFALLMVYFHWPCEPGIDRSYAGSLAGRLLAEAEPETDSEIDSD